jgi:hypothetical protein
MKIWAMLDESGQNRRCLVNGTDHASTGMQESHRINGVQFFCDFSVDGKMEE